MSLVNEKIDSLSLTVLDHRLVDARFLLLFLLASVRFKTDFAMLKLGDGLQDSPNEEFRMSKFILLLDFLELVVQFDALVLLIVDSDRLLAFLVVEGVNALHLPVAHQLQFVCGLL